MTALRTAWLTPPPKCAANPDADVFSTFSRRFVVPSRNWMVIPLINRPGWQLTSATWSRRYAVQPFTFLKIQLTWTTITRRSVSTTA